MNYGELLIIEERRRGIRKRINKGLVQMECFIRGGMNIERISGE
jgi:hypothetical protein